MAKRRSKIKLGGRTPLRDTRSRGPLNRPVLSRKLTRQLELNAVRPRDDTCATESTFSREDGVKTSDVININTETATADSVEAQSEPGNMSPQQDTHTDKQEKMKKASPTKTRTPATDKTPCTCPREIDGETCLDVECGSNNAVLYLDKLFVGSKGTCIMHEGSWLTPNEFQFVSGRETAKDWKRSIKHNGFSLKLLIVNGCVELKTAPPSASQKDAAAANTDKTDVVGSNKSRRAAKAEKKAPTPEPEESTRRYVPAKRRAEAVKEKVGGKRRKLRRSKKASGRRGASKPGPACPAPPDSPDVADGNKENVDVTPCPSNGDDKAEVDPLQKQPIVEDDEETEMEEDKDEEKDDDRNDDKDSEEFFKTLQLSKTPCNSGTPSPVSEQTETRESAITAQTTAVQKDQTEPEQADDAIPKVVETFRSRLIADDTRLRIAINRQVVCMKDGGQDDDEAKVDCSVSEGASPPEATEPIPETDKIVELPVSGTVDTNIVTVEQVNKVIEKKVEPVKQKTVKPGENKLESVLKRLGKVEQTTKVTGQEIKPFELINKPVELINKPLELKTETVENTNEVADQKTEMCNVKVETVSKTDSQSEMVVVDATCNSPPHILEEKPTLDCNTIVETVTKEEPEIPHLIPAIIPCAKTIEHNVNSNFIPKEVLKQKTDCMKCDEKDVSPVSPTMKTLTDEISKACMRTHTVTSSADMVKTSALLKKSCFKHDTTMVPCNCDDKTVKSSPEKDVKLAEPGEVLAGKTVSLDSLKCHRKPHEPRTPSTPKTVSESTFQEKTQYENEMLELMSIYRPVMMPCDGRCPYVCPETAPTVRPTSDAPTSPYTACQTAKWPVTSPFLSGVMTPEMMYYMTQQLYMDMYNTSLMAQYAASGEKHSEKHSDKTSDKHSDKHSEKHSDRHSDKHTEKHSQPKPVKRKAPETDSDVPLDLSVKRVKIESDKPKLSHTHTQENDSPLDFSKKASHTVDNRKVAHTHAHTNKPTHTAHNGSFKSNGYSRPKPSSQHSAPSFCTCRKKEDIRTWNVEKVCSFLKQYHDCAIYTKTFREQGIDGRLLPYLTMQHLTRTLGMQTGPAITFLDAVDQQMRAGTSSSRQCNWCKA